MSRRTILSLASFLFLIVIIIFFGLKPAGDSKMENKNIQVENFENCVPKNNFDFDFKLAKEKELTSSSENITAEYLELQSKYDKAFSLFFDEKTSLNQLNAQLDLLNLIKVPKMTASELNDAIEDMNNNPEPYHYGEYFKNDYYRSSSHIKSDYLYLRNNIKIERLNDSDIKLLKTLDLDKTTDKEKLLEMVSRTYIDVLSVRKQGLAKEEQKEDYKVTYTNNLNETVGNKAVVFYLSYKPEYDKNGNAIPENREKNIEKENEVEKIAEEYSSIFSNELNCEVKIFIHY